MPTFTNHALFVCSPTFIDAEHEISVSYSALNVGFLSLFNYSQRPLSRSTLLCFNFEISIQFQPDVLSPHGLTPRLNRSPAPALMVNI